MAGYKLKEDTIAAISTGLSSGGIGIVRVSGPEAFSIADRLFVSPTGKIPSSLPSYTLSYGKIVFDGVAIDEVLLAVMRAPRTYTREDIVEIQCHGGIFVLRKILSAVLFSGARPAEPGEFTKRAFLNGRIDLSEAEAVMDLIESDSEKARQSALSQLGGAVREEILKLREKILYETAYIEAALDDPEHYDLTGYAETLRKKTEEVLRRIQALLATKDDGRVLKEGIKTVILGRPNVGKSTLMNALCGTETAIVTDIAGTTRDILQEEILLSGIPVHIIDTAGLRETDNVVERIGVERALESAKRADLILYVVDAGSPIDAKDEKEIGELLSLGKKMILLRNKADLLSKEENYLCIQSECEEAAASDDAAHKPEIESILISAKTGEGLSVLKERIEQLFLSGEVNPNEQVYITNERQYAALARAEESLGFVINSIEEGMPEDLYTVDLTDAYAFLGEIIGEEVGEDLINEIFSKFCMGK